MTLYCDACGANIQGRLRCPSCHAAASWAWILGTATLAWAAGVALYLVVARLMFPDVAKLFAGLGTEPPLPARLYFVLSARVFPAVAALVAVAPIVVMTAGRNVPGRLYVWSRRWALSAILGVGWALLGVAVWYLCVAHIIDALK